MNWDAIGAVGEILGAIAVVATLAYLAAQIRHSVTAMKAQAYQARSDDLQHLAVKVTESEVLARIWTEVVFNVDGKARIDEEKFEALAPIEITQFRYFLTAHAHRIENLFKQYELGFLDQDYYERILVPSTRYFVPIWRKFDVFQGRFLAERIEGFTRDT